MNNYGSSVLSFFGKILERRLALKLLYHKDLIQVLPNDLLKQLFYDCCDIAEKMQWTGTSGDIFNSKVINFMPDDFYNYFILVKDELVKRRIMDELPDFDRVAGMFMSCLSIYCGRKNFAQIDYPFIFQGWMSTRYLMQCIMVLEMYYDNDAIELKDWFRIVNHIRNLNQLTEETFDNLFT